MWYIRLQELTVKGLKMTGNFLKPYGIELIDTLIYILKSIFSLIISILPKRQMIYSWRLKRVIPNVRRYFLIIFLLYFALAISISRVKAGEKYIIPKGEITEEEKEPLKRVKQEQNKVLYDTVKGYEPKKVDDQYCYVKIEIKQNGDDVIKQEILECADGKRGINTPSYWELFAQFYYRDVSAPEYCRFYSRPNHVFKSFGKTCLNKSGEWEVQ
jgi:hypothetical protein